MRVIIFFLFITISFTGIANPPSTLINGKLILLDGKNTYHQGEVVDLRLEIWPLEEKLLEQMKELITSKEIAKSIKITTISELGFSQNNTQALIVRAKGIFLKELKSDSSFNLMWELGYNRVKLNVPALTVLKTNEIQQFNFWESRLGPEAKSIPAELIGLIVFIIIFLLSVALYFVHSRYMNKKKAKLEYKTLWESEETREQYERIFKLRNDLLPLCSNPQVLSSYLNYLTQIQYKKEWDNEELEKVSVLYRDLKRQFQ